VVSEAFEPACKPDSVEIKYIASFDRLRTRRTSPWRSSVWDAHCCAPRAAYLRISEPPHLRNLALLPVGFAEPPHHCGAGALLPHHFTLTE